MNAVYRSPLIYVLQVLSILSERCQLLTLYLIYKCNVPLQKCRNSFLTLSGSDFYPFSTLACPLDASNMSLKLIFTLCTATYLFSIGSTTLTTSHLPLKTSITRAHSFDPRSLNDAPLSTTFPLTRLPTLPRNAAHFGSARIYATRHQISWYAEVMVGVQKLKLILDTGSSDTWLIGEGFQCYNTSSTPHSEIDVRDCRFGKTFFVEEEFDPIPDENFGLQYSDGEFLSGVFGVSDVTFASVPVAQQIAVVQKAGWHGDGVTSGVIGLAYPALTAAFRAIGDNGTRVHVPYSPILTTMAEQGIILPVFSIAMNRDPAVGSYLALGGVVPGIAVFGEWATTPIEFLHVSYLDVVVPGVPQHQFYAITPDCYLYQNASITQVQTDHWIPLVAASENTTSSLPSQTIVDTGTTLVYLPPPTAHLLASLFEPPAIWDEEEGLFLVSCQALAPSFAVQIGGVVFPVEKQDLLLDEQREDEYCQAGFTAGELASGIGIGILGDVFLRNVLVVFDVGAAQIRLKATGYY